MAEKKKQEISVSLEQLEDIAKQITEIDTKISAASGSEAQMKKSIAQALATENSEQVDAVLGQVVPQFEKLEVPVLAGLLDRLEDALKEKFKPAIDEFIDARVKEQGSSSAEDVAALRETRKARVEGFRALKTILDTFGIDTESVPEPKRAAGRPSGSGGAKSGKNKEGYQYTMDGKDRPPSQNSFSSLAYYSTNGCAGTEEKPERWGSDQLKSFIAEQGVNFGTDDTWEVTLPNGTKVGARKDAALVSGSSDETGTEEASTETAPEPANA